MIKVAHVLRSYGNPNQEYSRKFLEELEINKKISNSIYCDVDLRSLKESRCKIFVLKFNKRNIFLNIYRIFKVFFFDKRMFKIKDFSFREKAKFILKYYSIISENIDIIHIHHLHAVNLLFFKFFDNDKCKLVCSLRGKDIVINPLEKNQRQLLLKKIMYIDIVHVISDYLHVKALEINIPDEKIRVIYRGYNVQEIDNDNLKSNNLVSERVKFISVGRLAWEKGHFYLLDNFYQLKKKGFNFKLDIYGAGALKEFLDYRIKQLNLEEEVFLKGHLENSKLKELYKEYDYGIQPSIYEALSNGLIEMSLHKLPCVISNVGGMKEVIEDRVNGFYFDIKNPETLTQLLYEIRNFNINTNNFENKYKNNLIKFSLKKEINDFEFLYSNLIQ